MYMEIRFANENDNKKEIAELFYKVDPYIYPYWFNNDMGKGISTLTSLLEDKNSIFTYENCIIAKDGGKIIGLFSFVPYNKKINKDYSRWDVSFEAHHVITYYVLDVVENLKEDDVCVLGLYVDPSYRRKNIATKIFNFFFKNVKSKTYSLEVLANNLPALNLYNKLNFEISKSYNGYNGYKKRKPLCYVMTRMA